MNDSFNGFEAFSEFTDGLRQGEMGSSKEVEFDSNKEVKGAEQIETEDDLENIISAVQNKAKQKTVKTKEETTEEETSDEEESTEDEVVEEKLTDTKSSNEEVNAVGLFWQAFAEQNGIEVDEESVPNTVEDFFSNVNKVIEDKAKPKYANELVKEIDEYVKNGGSVEDYFTASESIYDLENIDLDEVDNQKRVLQEFLYRKGFSDTHIKRKIERYQDSDVLEDEAKDAYESLIDMVKEEKETLLKDQENKINAQKEAQQEFYTNVVNEIDILKDIRGIKIPEKDKKELVQYIFRVEADGTTKYQKDYKKNTSKNLIESAYFTMKGDILVNNAKRTGESDAVKKLKQALSSKSNNKSSSRQNIDDNDDMIKMLSTQLRNN